MRIGLVSNWGKVLCGVANFGRDWAEALEQAGHHVIPCGWHDRPACDHLIVNWDSGTLPVDEPLPDGCTVFIHHIYRGLPEGVRHAKLTISPVSGVGEYWPYPVPAPSPPVAFLRGSIGVTTLRGEGVDWLAKAADICGYRLLVPDRWRNTPEEVERLSHCAMLALWYTDSPGRSLALATALAAQRPILLTYPSRMFEYAQGSEEVYWAPYTYAAHEMAPYLSHVMAAVETETAKIPVELATQWSWPKAIARLEQLWAP